MVVFRATIAMVATLPGKRRFGAVAGDFSASGDAGVGEVREQAVDA
jgi:hypothetical protein